MLTYDAAASAFRFIQERIYLLNTTRDGMKALSIILDNIFHPHEPYGNTDKALEDFGTARANIQAICHSSILPSLHKGRHGHTALEDENLSIIFEPLGRSVHEQIHKVKRFAQGIENGLDEMLGISPELSSARSFSLAEAVGTKIVEIDGQEDDCCVELPTISYLEREIEAWKQAEERIVEIYATPRCLEWALSFQQRALPREIRDLIYLHLVNSLRLQDQAHACIGPKDRHTQLSNHQLFPHVRKALHQHSWFMNPQNFGPEIALEITQVLFSEASFWLTNSQFIPTLLTYNPYNLKLQPLDYIKALTILHWSDLSDLHSTLMHLCKIKRKDVLKLDLRFYTPSYRPRAGKTLIGADKTMLRFLEDLRYPIYELIHSGSEVSIWQVVFNERAQLGWYTYGHRRLTPFCSDLSESLNRSRAPVVDFFTLTAEEWIREKAIEFSMDPAKHYLSDVSESGISDALRVRWRQSGALEGFHIFSSQHHPGDGSYLILSDRF